MLAEAAREIAGRGARVTLIARSPEALAREIGAEALAMDWRSRDDVARALALLRARPAPDLMISWIHADGLWCLPGLEGLLAAGARSIRVHGSAAGDPRTGVTADPPPPAQAVRQHVVLGWVNEARGRRWLTDAEISGGVIAALDDPAAAPRIVGTLT
jgi:hypothetical protein